MKTTITIRTDYSKIARGHSTHKSGAGTHADRRQKRQRTRGAANRAAMRDN